MLVYQIKINAEPLLPCPVLQICLISTIPHIHKCNHNSYWCSQLDPLGFPPISHNLPANVIGYLKYILNPNLWPHYFLNSFKILFLHLFLILPGRRSTWWPEWFLARCTESCMHLTKTPQRFLLHLENNFYQKIIMSLPDCKYRLMQFYWTLPYFH